MKWEIIIAAIILLLSPSSSNKSSRGLTEDDIERLNEKIRLRDEYLLHRFRNTFKFFSYNAKYLHILMNSRIETIIDSTNCHLAIDDEYHEKSNFYTRKVNELYDKNNIAQVFANYTRLCIDLWFFGKYKHPIIYTLSDHNDYLYLIAKIRERSSPLRKIYPLIIYCGEYPAKSGTIAQYEPYYKIKMRSDTIYTFPRYFYNTTNTIIGGNSTRKYRLMPIICHEIGHYLGLGHIPNSKSIMFDFHLADSNFSNYDHLIARSYSNFLKDYIGNTLDLFERNVSSLIRPNKIVD